MARSARPAKRRRPPRAFWADRLASAGAVLARNPVATGGTVAFLVAFSFVSANAIWYQPHAHRDAFFPTRDFVRSFVDTPEEPETTFLIERPAPTARPRVVPIANPTTAKVQGVLKQLGFYDGTVDGISGPATVKAIDTYRRTVGLNGSATIDASLLEQLGIEPTTAGIRPSPAPRDEIQELLQSDEQTVALTKQVQAGLRAHKYPDMAIDGILGAQTKTAIKEYQARAGLKVTGMPDKTLLAKMRLDKLIK
jgi:peptidoglycan hydrolase-like protein with peptidoglycan-binding domain